MHRPNAELVVCDLPPAPASVDDVFSFAACFDGYGVWGGFEPCARVADQVHQSWERESTLPESLTLLRSALFFEARRERFVDFGGFGDDPAGFAEHHDYMRELLESVRRFVVDGLPDSEDQVVARWLETNPPGWAALESQLKPDPDLLTFEPPALDDDQVSAAVTLAARLIGVDLESGLHVDEDRVRGRIALALGHLSPLMIETERGVDVEGFRGVGPVDIVVRDLNGVMTGLFEVKWSVDLNRDKIFEAAWDAIKLALAKAPGTKRWLVTGAPEASWRQTETADLFSDGIVDTKELWTRPLLSKGPNGGMTVGADCEAGGRGNMFMAAPERLRIKHIVTADVPGTTGLVKAARVVGGEGRSVTFAQPPEFPQRITQHWLEQHVPPMPADEYERLIAWLRLKRWTDTDLQSRVHPLRTAQ